MNPNDLWGKDNQAFAVVREYLHAVRTTQTNKAQKIYEANIDLQPYFNFVVTEHKRNPYYAL